VKKSKAIPLLLLWLAACRGETITISYATGTSLRTRYVEQGDSMLPLIHPGDWLRVDKTVPYRDLKAGMVAVFNWQGELVSHELVRLTRYGWITKGINNRDPDRDYLTERDYVGVVVEIFR